MKNLRVILLHGTWGAGSDWKNPGSEFESLLRRRLSDEYANVRFDAIPWNAKNRWKARQYVAEQLDRWLAEYKADDDGSWEYLLIAHSHGGNIATEAVRERMRKDRTVPIVGIACLNTPFLRHEVRASSSYLKTWILIALLLAFGLLALPTTTQSTSLLGLRVAEISTSTIAWMLVSLSAVLLLLLALNRRLGRAAKRSAQDSWEPRPEVLCLSCADDEAITLLGLGEGIANLPQLLLHPIGFAVALLGSGALLYLDPGLSWCGASMACWSYPLQMLASFFAIWLLVALVGGAIGTVVISLMFGLSLLQTVENLVSRVLVSYVPLRPAHAYFRGVSDIELSWVNPLQLFHSQLYRSPRAVDEICTWLIHYARARMPSASALAA